MSWSRQGYQWRRPLDCHDKLFRSIAAAGKPLGREHWLLVGAARVGFPPQINKPEDIIRTAWSSLRFRHPDIALDLDGDEKIYEPVTNTESLEAWATATFHVENTVNSADELFSRHLKIAGSSATCHYVATNDEIAIVSSHWRWDGRGLVMMLHELLVELQAAAAAEVQNHRLTRSFSQDESHKLVPSLDVVMDVPMAPKVAWSARADELLAPLQNGRPTIGLPVTGESLPRDTRRMGTVISREKTEFLLEACRSRGIRLTAALQASVIVETARFQLQPDTGPVAQFKSWGAFDLRRYCPPPFDGPTHAPSLRMLGLPLVVDASVDWDALALSMQTFYEKSFVPAESDLMFVRVPFVEKATAMLAAATPTTEPSLSNLGVMDRYVQKKYGDGDDAISVHNIWLAVQMLSPQLYVHTWSWDGELHISICYNEAFYEEAFVAEWLRSLEKCLFTNLF